MRAFSVGRTASVSLRSVCVVRIFLKSGQRRGAGFSSTNGGNSDEALEVFTRGAGVGLGVMGGSLGSKPFELSRFLNLGTL